MKATKILWLILLIIPILGQAETSCFCLVDVDDNRRHSCEYQRQGITEVARRPRSARVGTLCVGGGALDDFFSFPSSAWERLW